MAGRATAGYEEAMPGRVARYVKQFCEDHHWVEAQRMEDAVRFCGRTSDGVRMAASLRWTIRPTDTFQVHAGLALTQPAAPAGTARAGRFGRSDRPTFCAVMDPHCGRRRRGKRKGARPILPARGCCIAARTAPSLRHGCHHAQA